MSYNWIKKSKLYLTYKENDSECSIDDIINITPEEFLFTLPFDKNYNILKMVKIINYWDIILPECYLLLGYDKRTNKDILAKELKTAAEGHTELIKHFIEFCKEEYRALSWACKGGFLECLIYLDKYTLELKDCNTYLLNLTAENGHLKCLRFLDKLYPELKDVTTMEKAALGGNLQSVIYLYTSIVSNEYKKTDPDLTKYCYNTLSKGCIWNSQMTTNACKKGSLDILKYLHKQGCPWHSSSSFEASANGNLEILKYLHENKCKFDKHIITYAVGGGHIDCVKYLREIG